MSTNFDLSTLSLDEGTYSVTVKAKETNLIESEASEGVSYTVQLAGTWVINSTFEYSLANAFTCCVSGQFYGLDKNENIVQMDLYQIAIRPGSENCIHLRSDENTAYPLTVTTIYGDGNCRARYYGAVNYVLTKEYSVGNSIFNKLHIIVIDSNVEDVVTPLGKNVGHKLLAWLKANATKR